MDIEQLSKSQLILLMLLINFVTSVATGILTVSLLDQAPPVVTQTINRVVDHTIEKVIEAAPIITSPAPSNQDLVMSAIASDAAHTVAIFDERTGTSTPALAIGTYLPTARAVVTAVREGMPKEVLIGFPGGGHIAASLSHTGSGLIIYGFSDSATLPKATAVTLVAAKDLKLGQTVIGISLDGSAATGIVSRVGEEGVRTTLPDLGLGSAAVDLSGNMVGIVTSTTQPSLLTSAEVITALLTATPGA